MRSSWKQRPVYDRNDPYRTGPLVVNYDLDQLKVGENWVIVGRKDGYDIHDRALAPGDGWSQALCAPECCWPSGAELCVRVEWHPDLAVGSDWTARTKAVASGLRSLGYLVEHAGRPADPDRDLSANLLVYRMEPGIAPPRRPQDAWAHVPAPRTYTWPENDPREQVRRRLSKIKSCEQGARLTVWDIESALWPPEADFCVQVRWWPAPGTSTESLYEGLQEITSLMRDDDLQVRAPERPLSDAVESVDLLVYREVEEPVNSP